jgi:hypothetical protein
VDIESEAKRCVQRLGPLAVCMDEAGVFCVMYLASRDRGSGIMGLF